MTEDALPLGFFDRSDAGPDDAFYAWPRLVTHIDDRAIAAVRTLYDELGLAGDVLDLMGSWVSHFRTPPRAHTVLGMNADELAANAAAHTVVVHDLNVDPVLPFDTGSFDAVVCCVSVDYLTRPIEVFAEVARVVRPGGIFVTTFSNRCFPTKAIRGWLATSDAQHVDIVSTYFRLAGGWDEPVAQLRTPPGPGDPLYAVWARRGSDADAGTRAVVRGVVRAVAGASWYQDVLRALAATTAPSASTAPRTAKPARHRARLRAEPTNQYDPDAVRVEIDGQVVGHLLPEHAARITARLQADGPVDVEAELVEGAHLAGGDARPPHHADPYVDVLVHVPESYG